MQPERQGGGRSAGRRSGGASDLAPECERPRRQACRRRRWTRSARRPGPPRRGRRDGRPLVRSRRSGRRQGGEPTREDATDRETGIQVVMAASELPTPEERETFELVEALRATGNLRPLVTVLRNPDGGPERARDALVLLADLD